MLRDRRGSASAISLRGRAGSARLVSPALLATILLAGVIVLGSTSTSDARRGGGGDRGRQDTPRFDNNRNDNSPGKGDWDRGETRRPADSAPKPGDAASPAAAGSNSAQDSSGNGNAASAGSPKAVDSNGNSRDEDNLPAKAKSGNPGQGGRPSPQNRQWGDDLPQTVEEMFRRWSKPAADMPSPPPPSFKRGDDQRDHERGHGHHHHHHGQHEPNRGHDGHRGHHHGHGHGHGKGKDRDGDDKAPVVETGTTTKAPVTVVTPSGVAPLAIPLTTDQADSKTTAQANQPQTGQAKAPSRGSAAFPQFEPPLPEVLTGSLSPKALNAAKQRGFKELSKSTLASVGFDLWRFGIPPDMSVEDAQRFLQQLDGKPRADPNNRFRIFRTATGTTDSAQPAPKPMTTPCGTDRCLGPAMIGWRRELSACTQGMPIGVVDTSIDAGHPAFKGRSLTQYRSAPGDAPKARNANMLWHGTGIVSQLAGHPDSETPGLAPGARFFVADVFNADTDGLPVSDTYSLVTGINWLGDKGVRVINMSLAGPDDDNLRRAVESLVKQKTLFIAAVGNSGPNSPPAYPSAYRDVIAVTAVAGGLQAYRHAGRGAHVDLSAPGVRIWTASPSGNGEYHSGTSFAAPYATAVVASIYRDLKTKTKDEALDSLAYVDLGAPGRDPVYGRGLLVAPAACNPKTGPAPTPFITSFKPAEQAQLNR